jgi:hypothetical protein
LSVDAAHDNEPLVFVTPDTARPDGTEGAAQAPEQPPVVREPRLTQPSAPWLALANDLRRQVVAGEQVGAMPLSGWPIGASAYV